MFFVLGGFALLLPSQCREEERRGVAEYRRSREQTCSANFSATSEEQPPTDLHAVGRTRKCLGSLWSVFEGCCWGVKITLGGGPYCTCGRRSAQARRESRAKSLRIRVLVGRGRFTDFTRAGRRTSSSGGGIRPSPLRRPYRRWRCC